MLKSMTGYGRACRNTEGLDIVVDIKCVNHRYLEPSFRISRSYSYLEEFIKAYLPGKIERGKIEIAVSVTDSGRGVKLQLNSQLVEAYDEALRQMAAKLNTEYVSNVNIISRFPEVFSLEQAEEDENGVWESVKPVVDEAFERFSKMRRAEGEKLAEDIENRLKAIEGCVSFVEERAAGFSERYLDRLYQKLKTVLEDRNIDESRLLQEAAIYADKAAVDEETVRLRSHISQMRGFLNSREPVGKKMDFLVQEFNREANTIGSKCSDIEVTRTVVELKAQIEKMREQIQNIE